MARRLYDPKREDIRTALDYGWTFLRISGGGHLQFTHPGTGMKMTLPQTPSCSRALKNGAAWVRKNTPREE